MRIPSFQFLTVFNQNLSIKLDHEHGRFFSYQYFTSLHIFCLHSLHTLHLYFLLLYFRTFQTRLVTLVLICIWWHDQYWTLSWYFTGTTLIEWGFITQKKCVNVHSTLHALSSDSPTMSWAVPPQTSFPWKNTDSYDEPFCHCSSFTEWAPGTALENPLGTFLPKSKLFQCNHVTSRQRIYLTTCHN